eukprot:GILJ01003811.1.p1 GENE.GILJ01003811.1~~GILJ01003811.1.p1  ORF type:complete len:258 (+),score=48.46 GILJ01003811.1:38-811(+)
MAELPASREVTMTPVDDGDEIVRELDVYVSSNLIEQLYLLQFPLRPLYRPYGDQGALSEVRLRPVQQRLEMDYQINAMKATHDEDTAEYKTSKQTLKSTLVPPRTNYAVAVLRGDTLHLSAIDSTVQLKPSFGYIDSEVEKLKMMEQKLEEHGIAEEEKPEEPEELPQPLQVQYKKKETERQAAARNRSHAYLKKKEDEEPWVKMKCLPAESAESQEMFEKLFCLSSNIPIPFDIASHRYLSLMNPSVKDPYANPSI